MKATITCIIATVILFIILVAMWMPFDRIVTEMDSVVNDTSQLDAADKTSIHGFYDTLRTLFSMLFVISLISIPIAYFIDSHRQEYEEFQEYDRYGPF